MAVCGDRPRAAAPERRWREGEVAVAPAFPVQESQETGLPDEPKEGGNMPMG